MDSPVVVASHQCQESQGSGRSWQRNAGLSSLFAWCFIVASFAVVSKVSTNDLNRFWLFSAQAAVFESANTNFQRIAPFIPTPHQHEDYVCTGQIAIAKTVPKVAPMTQFAALLRVKNLVHGGRTQINICQWQNDLVFNTQTAPSKAHSVKDVNDPVLFVVGAGGLNGPSSFSHTFHASCHMRVPEFSAHSVFVSRR